MYYEIIQILFFFFTASIKTVAPLQCRRKRSDKTNAISPYNNSQKDYRIIQLLVRLCPT